MKTILFTSVFALVAALPAPVIAQQAQYIQCDSVGHNVSRCPADTRGGVSLVSQQSRSGCYFNDTWGYDAQSIWVSNGCRAEFAVNPPSHRGSGHHHDNRAASAAAIALLGAAVIAAGNDSNKHRDDRKYRDYANRQWQAARGGRGPSRDNSDAPGTSAYESEYNNGCSAARGGGQYSDYAPEGWRTGFHDCSR